MLETMTALVSLKSLAAPGLAQSIKWCHSGPWLTRLALGSFPKKEPRRCMEKATYFSRWFSGVPTSLPPQNGSSCSCLLLQDGLRAELKSQSRSLCRSLLTWPKFSLFSKRTALAFSRLCCCLGTHNWSWSTTASVKEQELLGFMSYQEHISQKYTDLISLLLILSYICTHTWGQTSAAENTKSCTPGRAKIVSSRFVFKLKCEFVKKRSRQRA